MTEAEQHIYQFTAYHAESFHKQIVKILKINGIEQSKDAVKIYKTATSMLQTLIACHIEDLIVDIQFKDTIDKTKLISELSQKTIHFLNNLNEIPSLYLDRS